MNTLVSGARAPRKRRDYRIIATVMLIAAVALLGYAFSLIPGRGVAIDKTPSFSSSRSPFAGLPESSSGSGNRRQAVPEAAVEPAKPQAERFAHFPSPAKEVLAAAEAHIVTKRFDEAIANLDAHREALKPHAETYLLMGAALEGKQHFEVARDFYNAAAERNPYLADAHFGFATTSEALGDLESALGGMRSFLHTESDLDPNRLKVAQARSAIWEWEAQLGRGAWGPTRGIPPGFTADEVKRDGRGVGIKMPIPGTEQPDGTMRYEIKAQDKFQMFKPH